MSAADDQACPVCHGCGMLPGREENDDVMNTPCWQCNPHAKLCGNCAHRTELFEVPPLGTHLHCNYPSLEIRDSEPFNAGWGTLRDARETCPHFEPRNEPQILENATCDGCGNTNTFVQVINSTPVSSGICLCRKCLESDFERNA